MILLPSSSLPQLQQKGLRQAVEALDLGDLL
jgi:hypothetical protein